MKVYLTHTDEAFAGYFGDRALAALREHAEVVRNTSGRVLAGAALAEAAAGCQAIIAHRATPGLAETFAAAPDLVAFLRGAVDVSTIDLPAASEAGVLVTQATPGFVDAVAELGIGLMIDLARGISHAGAAWQHSAAPPARPGLQLSTATLGLLGYGRIARRMAVLARAFGMRVLAHDPEATIADGEAEPVSLPALLAGADVVVCLAAATPETADLMNAAAFAAMRRGSFFINLARGELVDEAALEAALESGHLAGAAMDVGRAPDQKPSPRLARRPDVVATPHIGGLTREAAEHQAMDTVRQVAALAAGRMPEGALNPEAAHRLRRLGIGG
ncbi:NAD(P)-dependent oxidoreductase [Roseomonas sp. KE0001]|uniref:NAD(P)-dependent oxidoreductase n=1 Tax=Roseomonas sp. KE0001 TaxID=2479201 RepID=UPI0018DEF675|nr:NAD(P)-dependent oxidoreductase [Roseomonas sp. KE0001]MBI0432255.1 hydroxyacid dehydrogenase [Roseomonas sp. KE0001]